MLLSIPRTKIGKNVHGSPLAHRTIFSVLLSLYWLICLTPSTIAFAKVDMQAASHESLNVLIPKDWRITYVNGDYEIKPTNSDEYSPNFLISFQEISSHESLTELVEKVEANIARLIQVLPQLAQTESFENGAVVRISSIMYKGRDARLATYLEPRTIAGRSMVLVAVFSALSVDFQRLDGINLVLAITESATLTNLPSIQERQNQASGVSIPRFDIPTSCEGNGVFNARGRGGGSVFESRTDCIRGEQDSYNLLKHAWPQVTDAIRSTCIAKESTWSSYRTLLHCINDRVAEPKWKW